MRCRRALSISLSIIVVASTGRMAFADTDTPSSAQETAVRKPAAEQPSAKPAPTEAKPSDKPTTTSACPRCSDLRPPVYVADWARLAALTQSDSLVFPQVDEFAQRHDTVHTFTVGGVVLGGIAAMLGSFHAVSADEWSKFDKWSLAGGVSLTAVSLFIAWAMEPDRDDFLTLINQWNLRHPQQVLSP
jgi:hypothetical protein